MSTAISISELGKRYLIGAARERAGTLRDAITNAASAPSAQAASRGFIQRPREGDSGPCAT